MIHDSRVEFESIFNDLHNNIKNDIIQVQEEYITWKVTGPSYPIFSAEKPVKIELPIVDEVNTLQEGGNHSLINYERQEALHLFQEGGPPCKLEMNIDQPLHHPFSP